MYDEGDPPRGRPRAAILARLGARAKSPFAWLAGEASRRHLDASPARRQPSAAPPPWAAEIAFLVDYGLSADVLSAATALAHRHGVSAEAALFATGAISETHYYLSLAHHLRLPFIDGHAVISLAARYPEAIHAGIAPLAGRTNPVFLVAPRGAAIAYLISAAHRGEIGDRLAIAAPTYFSRLLRDSFRSRIVDDASFALPVQDPTLCTRSHRARVLAPFAAAAISALGLLAISSMAAPGTFLATLLGASFFAVVLLRIVASAAAVEAYRLPRRALKDDDLPLYSLVIALYREARVVPQLVAALEQLDYPRAKLDIKFIIEEDDSETLAALRRTLRRFGQEIIVAPDGAPRTKPRALNVALPLLRGELVAVFDAEDIPHPRQLRDAAEHFARAPRELACLQARLAIDNLEGWLPRLFAIEYAALFDVINVGLADLHLPFPLGGSSNHFRTKVLREIGGWDAWNVTEDADIGFRLARFGYRAATFNSTTYEEAPARVAAFLGQRRRWCKGWYQTLFTLCRSPHRLIREVGLWRGMITVVVLLSSALTPLGGSLGLALCALTLANGGPAWPSSGFEIGAATLWTSVLFGGMGAILGPILIGMKRRRLLALWPSLLLLPVYYALISFAAWTSLYDLVVRPYHWCKTEHGLSASRRHGTGRHRFALS